MFFKKKNNRYDNQIDRYTKKYKESFMLGLIYFVVGGVGYAVYILFFE